MGDRAEEFSRELDNLGTNPREVDIEDLVRRVLVSAGVGVISQARVSTGRPDFAVWVDELEAVTGNPMVVEVKKNLRNRNELQNAYRQVCRYLDAMGAPFGLILYLNGSKNLSLLAPLLDQRVQFYELRRFLSDLKRNPLHKLISRNRAGWLSTATGGPNAS